MGDRLVDLALAAAGLTAPDQDGGERGIGVAGGRIEGLAGADQQMLILGPAAALPEVVAERGVEGAAPAFDALAVVGDVVVELGALLAALVVGEGLAGLAAPVGRLAAAPARDVVAAAETCRLTGWLTSTRVRARCCRPAARSRRISSAA